MNDETAGPAVKVVFTPSGKRGTFPVGTNLLQAARDLGVDLDSVCGGRGICGRCQITISTGRFAKFGIESTADHLSAFSANEHRYKNRRGMAEERRLGCHATVQGDLVIDVPPDSQVHKQVVRKRAEVRDITINPAVRLHYVEVEKPDMHRPTGDFERLAAALRDQWGLGELEGDIRILQGLQKILRDGDWTATVAIHRSERIIAIWPGFRDKAYGLAYDVGSTTVAAHLADLSTGEVVASVGVMNPQIRFGEDLMSRVSYAMMNPGGEAELTAAVWAAVNRLVADATAEAGVAAEDILNATFVGNPIMHHLLLGIDPVELGGAPFALATNRAQTLWASEIGLAVNPDARVYFLPCIAGHVGADAAGVILSETPYLSEETVLIVDVGTNAEIVLGNKKRILAASSPTGPAFEGAQIICGQRAAPGAIERVRIDPETLEARIKVIGCELWSDEAGFEAETGDTGVTGICGSGIIEALAEMYLAGLIRPDGTIDGGMGARTDQLQAEERTFSYRLFRGGRPRHPRLPGRRPGDPACQGGALCRRPAAHGPAGHCRAGPDRTGRGFRHPYRTEIRHGPRHDPGLRPRQGNLCGQRRRHRRADCVAQPGGARRNRTGRAQHRKGRDRRRSRIPAPFRRCDGAAPCDGRLSASRQACHPAGASGRR